MPRIADLRFRKDTALNWTNTNPTLNAGEPGIETDTGKLKVGNGVNQWNALPYVGAGTSDNALKLDNRKLFVSTTAPSSGMVNGDIWIKI